MLATNEHTILFGREGNAGDAIVLGWSAPEDGYTWTVGKRSVLCTFTPRNTPNFALEILWSPYLPPGSHQHQTVGISVGGRRIALHEVRGLETVTFPCPPPQPHEQRLLIEFDLPNAAQPSVVAGHHDDRMLALCVRSIKILPRDEPPTLAAPPALATVAEGEIAVTRHSHGWPWPQTGVAAECGTAGELDLAFGTEGNAGPFTREGWSDPEPGYLWTLGGQSRLTLPRPAQPGEWELEVEVQPFVHGEALPAQRLGLILNGVACSAVPVSDHAVVRLDVPWRLLKGGEVIDLLFTLPDASRPMDVAGGSDDRPLGFAFKRLRLFPAAPPALPSAPLAAVTANPDGSALEMPVDRLMLQFESLGENCEFGLVQRACGAEPLGLLRFASAPLPKLLAALRARFKGLGEADNINVEVSENRREYMIRDRAFNFYYHAWVLVGEKTPAEILAREVRRVPFLVNKLIDDLTIGEKIFVYHGMQPLSLPNARSLVRAMRDYGQSTLLWVELADAEHTCGTVERIEEGLLKGYIDRFAPGENAHDFAKESWVLLCRHAASLQLGLTNPDA
jgi:hypothetical protein